MKVTYQDRTETSKDDSSSVSFAEFKFFGFILQLDIDLVSVKPCICVSRGSASYPPGL
jgi:hypothetical protein